MSYGIPQRRTPINAAGPDCASRARRCIIPLLFGALCTMMTAAQTAVDTSTLMQTPALDLNALPDLDAVIESIADKRVVFVGEQHDHLEHHLIQLEIIRRLFRLDPHLAIGMEMFQQPFQPWLDAYVAGEIDEDELLRETEYYSRWRFDYRLYAPILRYAREHRIPVVALNPPRELIRKVGQGGLVSLTEEERARLPADIDRSDTVYERHLAKIFEQHPNSSGQRLEHFIEVQLLWDEGMAERAAGYLETHPGWRMVVLAGGGHLAYGSGIPQRLLRRLPVGSVIVLNGWQGGIETGLADFILFPEPRSLPPAGRLGILLEEMPDQLRVSACQPDSPCQAAGIRRGDRLLKIDGVPVNNLADLRLALWDRLPGERVTVEVSRKRWFRKPELLDFNIVLHALP